LPIKNVPSGAHTEKLFCLQPAAQCHLCSCTGRFGLCLDPDRLSHATGKMKRSYNEATDDVFGTLKCNVIRKRWVSNTVTVVCLDVTRNPLPPNPIPPYTRPNPSFPRRNRIDTERIAPPLSSPTAAARHRTWAPPAATSARPASIWSPTDAGELRRLSSTGSASDRTQPFDSSPYASPVCRIQQRRLPPLNCIALLVLLLFLMLLCWSFLPSL
jgi:hypothetical protein